MQVGHFAVGFLAKRIEPRVSLGTFVLASMMADFLWCIFMIVGIEHVQFKPGMGAANYFDAPNIAMSHSLLMDAVWASLLAGAYFLRGHYPRGAWLLFAAVLSHWLLDFVSHRSYMPLAPGVARYFGLGLWTSILATVVVGGGFWLFAVILYTRATHVKKTGVYAFWIVIALLTLAWYNNIAGPPPPDPSVAPIVSLIFFSLLVAWAYWINRLPVRA